MKYFQFLFASFLLLNLISGLESAGTPVLHGLFHNDADDDHVHYGFLDLDVGQFNLLNVLNVKDVGNPKNRKYSALPMTYDPNEEVVYMAATSDQGQIILSSFNASTGTLLNQFYTIKNTVVSLQFDIFQKQLFAHLETNVAGSSVIVEINIADGTIKRTLATINNSEPTDVSSYCPICRKYFLIVLQNEQSVYVGVDSTDAGGISWQNPVNVEALSMKFDYKTFTMYVAYINQTNQFTSMIGVLNRTLGGISEVVGTISNSSNLFLTSLSAFDVAEKVYYSSDIFSFPYSWGVSWDNVTSIETNSKSFGSIAYTPYGWFVKQFIH